MVVRREFLMLAKNWTDLSEAKQDAALKMGLWASEKLDGQRAFWDGGVTRRVRAEEVPWANVGADERLLVKPVSTGLWSRYGKVIHAPDWWLNALPVGVPLDMELWAGHGRFQFVESTVRRGLANKQDSAWREIRGVALDCPTLSQVFEDGEVRSVNAHWQYEFGCRELVTWCESRGADCGLTTGALDTAGMIRKLMEVSGARACASPSWDIWNAHEQVRLPTNVAAAREKLSELENIVVSLKGEGLVLRAPGRTWYPKRMEGLWKVKRRQDAEGRVIGFTWGQGKLANLMGALILELPNKRRLELSGFTMVDREVMQYCRDVSCECMREQRENIGKDASDHWGVVKFPIGTVVTYSYRELTDDGLPKEAQYDKIHSGTI